MDDDYRWFLGKGFDSTPPSFSYHILSEWRKPLLSPRGVQNKLFPIFIIIIIIFTTLARY